MTWPPTWKPGETHFKEKGSPKVRRALKQRPIKNQEAVNKAAVRKADRFCRWPLCGCRKFKLVLHVAHLAHKGIGGNPRGDRSQPDNMILLCIVRHKEGRVSLDQGTAAIRPLTSKGTRGPCAFDLRLGKSWIEVAREIAPHEFYPILGYNRERLEKLARMVE